MGPGVPSVTVFLSWVLGSRPCLFFFHHIHVARSSSNLPLTFWLTAFLLLSCPRFCVTRYVTLLFLVVGLLMPVSSLSRRFLVSARGSPALVCFFSPDCDFSGRRRPRRVAFALLCARFLFWSVPPAPSCGSLQRRGLRVVTPALLCGTLLRRSRWTCASAVVYHNLVC